MQKVDSLVERARHLSLHPSTSTAGSLDAHLQKIYESFSASEVSKVDFLSHVQWDKPAVQVQTQPQSVISAEAEADPLASLYAFRAYMRDPASCAQGPAKELDLSAPLSDYFISSSHNTYLTGNQLYSDAAASAYTSVLLQGCRSVEIDVWDGEPIDPNETEDSSDSNDAEAEGKKSTLKSRIKDTIKSKFDSEEKAAKGALEDALHRKSKSSDAVTGDQSPVLGEPRVLHGHTLTKGTKFRDICYAIRDSAFVNSDLPVIISFEVHACLEQQQQMVDIINEAWKGLLVEVPSGVDADKLPTLAQLKRKILIKTKSMPLTESDETPEALEETDGSGGVQQKPAKPSKVLEALAKLAIYTRAYHFSNFEQPEAKVPGHVFSLSERSAREAHEKYRDALFAHNRCAMMRIYPYALRVTSSNLDPTFHWRRGAQLVALNWQNVDKGMMLNHGMFDGTQGWELKPNGYRSSEAPTDSILRTSSLDLTIEVFAAQDLPLPPNHTEKGFRPYLVCQLHVEEPEGPVAADRDDASSDTEKSSYRRRTKTLTGRNPDFKAQKLIFPTVEGVVEELSFVRFKIKDDELLGRDAMAAWACIRLDRLREGYRLVHLYDSTGEKTTGMLLVRITKQVA
ncbi:uncharacterized protein N7483_007718 [Penicillium malachiteum]|uniref:uncharacterized protein n=1 Tax=Penicillium malachiteum TaxID=1324776 RepID=UPI002548B8B5|nr:uncharacterized protein N7483_007718 [Penicillium malachiteum]KAJ5726361.1 hypothetical protein N7483_007718 [Penicillium malachiteum]